MATVARFDSDSTVAHAIAMPRRRGTADRKRALSALIEGEIIPRLLAAHSPAAAPGPSTTAVGGSDVQTLLPLTLEHESGDLLVHIESVLARGVTVETVLVDLLAPAARLLGEAWEDDSRDFVDVTLALWRLQQVVHEIAARAPADRLAAAGGHRALFSAMPGDQHDFGAVVIDELFQRSGWRTERLVAAETGELVKRAGENWFDLIGLTVSCDCHIAPLPALLAALRNVSMNPRVCIMVGGRIFSADPELAAKVGADGTALDAKLALTRASELVHAREGEALVFD